MKQQYIEKRFNRSSLETISVVNDIITDYGSQGYRLTVRQIYYQLVSRAVIANNLKEYKRVASILNDARLAGLMDWEAIEDRTREFQIRARWRDGPHALRSIAHQFHMDLWDTQPCRVYVVVEKEALVGVFERSCEENDIPLLAARGYPSISVVREFVETQLVEDIHNGQEVHILHFGDHDPSGIDMSRDLQDRFDTILSLHGLHGNYEFKRCALNMDQVRAQNPPENPAKKTDSRFASYRKKFGNSSWELDALSPSYLNSLVEDEIRDLIDFDAWRAKRDEIEDTRERIIVTADKWR